MSFRATTLRQLHVAMGLVLFSALPALAQVPNSPIVFTKQDAIVTSLVKAPALGSANGSSSGRDNQWLKVELHYAAIPQVGDFVNEVKFNVWIEGRDLLDPQGKPGEGIAVVMTGSVTYVNVAKSKDAYAVVYLHPSTLARYSTSRGVSDFDRTFDVHVEAQIDGKPVDAIDKRKEEDPLWYTKPKPVPGLVFLQNQCPFMNTDVDRYPALKLPESK